jgi:hypothetical protein
MILTHLNYLAVAVATVAYFMLGWLWFGIAFQKSWRAGHGMSNDEAAMQKMKKEMPKTIGSSFLFCFILTTAMAYFIALTDSHEWMRGAKMGIAAAVFACVPIAQNHMHTGKSFKVTLIDAGYHFFGLIIAGIILSVWA